MKTAQTFALTPTQRQLLVAQDFEQRAPGTILRDFEALLNLIGAAGLPVTPAHLFAMSSLETINRRLAQPLELRLKRALQKSYPPINGLYLLLRATGLGRIDTQGKPPRLQLDPFVLASWRSLHAAERYFALLRAWWGRASEEMIGERRGGWGETVLQKTLSFVRPLPENRKPHDSDAPGRGHAPLCSRLLQPGVAGTLRPVRHSSPATRRRPGLAARAAAADRVGASLAGQLRRFPPAIAGARGRIDPVAARSSRRWPTPGTASRPGPSGFVRRSKCGKRIWNSPFPFSNPARTCSRWRWERRAGGASPFRATPTSTNWRPRFSTLSTSITITCTASATGTASVAPSTSITRTWPAIPSTRSPTPSRSASYPSPRGCAWISCTTLAISGTSRSTPRASMPDPPSTNRACWKNTARRRSSMGGGSRRSWIPRRSGNARGDERNRASDHRVLRRRLPDTNISCCLLLPAPRSLPPHPR